MKKLLAGLAAAVLAAFLWKAGPAWYQRHLDSAVGRAGTKMVSCTHCHRRVQEPSIRGGPRAPGPRYLSPMGLAASPDGRSLFVAAEDADLLLKVDLASGKVAASAAVPGRPHGVAVSADGRLLAVSSRDLDRVTLLDPQTLQQRRELATGAEPLGLALTTDGRLFAAENGAGTVLAAGTCGIGSSAGAGRTDFLTAGVHLAAGREPYAVALSRDERRLVVANRLSNLARRRDVPVSELTVIDARRGRVVDRKRLVSAHLSEGVAVAADASFALAPVLHVRNLLPTTEVLRGGLMNSAVAFVDLRPGGAVAQFPLDEAGAFFADPSGIALTPDGRRAFVAHGGADVVTVLDVAALRRLTDRADDLGLSGRYVLARIPTLSNPRALALAPDGKRLYVSERLADSIAVIDTDRLRLVGRIDLGGPRALTAERRGERLFHDGSFTFQGQFSCRSCHPDGRTDALTWDFEIDGLGQEIVDSHSLLGIKDTDPFKWTGKNPTIFRQCGPRFSRVLMRTDPFPPDRLRDLVAYIESLPRLPRRLDPTQAEAIARGRQVFYRERTNTGQEIPKGNRCATCHPAPLHTIRLPFDVGTGGPFDTPHLMGIRYSAPYLHDGRSMTLEEIWTVHNPQDQHGRTND
ncbi:MAG: beta-propeller fold lactonase family protein, partial [Elusimicrobia bacterium]|nr:beta-propeller fold lactonase family protein [Elusimicrobiota bacterium]